jgi:hypothetical protein
LTPYTRRKSTNESAPAKEHPQKTLAELDKKLQTHFKGIEDDIFDREARNETLKSEEFRPPSGTLFEAIFRELKHKEEREKRKHSLSNIISRLRTRRAKKQLTPQTA